MPQTYYAIKEKGKPLQIHGYQSMLREWNDLPEGGYKLELKSTGRTRTTRQNSYYWAIMADVAQGMIDRLGHNPEDTTTEHVHDMFKGMFNKVNVINEKTGEMVSLPKSTTKLSTIEFRDYMEHIKRWTAEWVGIELPDPLEQLEINLDNDK